MNTKRYKFLHYLLIMLLMIAPLRGVIASQCDMGDMSDMNAAKAGNSDAATTFAMHASHNMDAMMHSDFMSSAHMSADSMPVDSIMNKHDCCDDISINCSGSCDLGINVSLLLQQSSYAPVYKNSFNTASLASSILFREITPPSRPPANFHS